MSTQQQLPQYKCHKQVESFKIAKLIPQLNGCLLISGEHHTAREEDRLQGEEESCFQVHVSQQYMDKHQPHAGGYFVRYPDGYASFSPAPAFEEGYTLIAPSTFRSRLYEEYEEVQIRTQKLAAFIGTPVFEGLPEIDQSDLKTQLATMQEYYQILNRRVSRLCNNA